MKSKIDKLDVDKLLPDSVDLSKLSEDEELVKKVNAIKSKNWL